MRHVLTDVFLWAGVALILIACVGVLAMRSAYARLHFSSPGILGSVLIAVAVVIKDSFSLVGDKALLVAVLAVVASPILTHATGRAARIDARGDWRLGTDEDVEVEEH